MPEDIRQLCPVRGADDTIAVKRAATRRMLGCGEDRIRSMGRLAIGEAEVDEDIEARATCRAALVTIEAVAGRVVVDDMLERVGCIGNLDCGDMSPVIVQFR